MKYFGVIALAVLATFAICTYGQSHNATWGWAGPRDVLMHREVAMKKSKVLQIVEGDLVFPRKGVQNYRNITAIRVADGYKNGKGGYASLRSGGIGYRNVTIHFKSQRGHGYNFTVDIYGH